MRAVEIREPGPPSVLQVCERPLPVPGPGELLIRVAAAGVNRPDCLQRRGGYAPPRGATDIPGLEVAGTLVAHGAGIDRPPLGERVCALVAGGGYAEYCTVPAPQCLPVPTGLSLTDAAAIPETFFTVWSNLFDRARLRQGEWLLVHGGASGIGTTAIQLGRAFGARVIATVGSAAKVALCERLGAERVVSYRTENFVDVVRELTAGRGVDVILDIVGGDYLEANIESLAVEGRLVVIGVLGGGKGTLNFGPLLYRRLTVMASTLRPRSVEDKAAIAAGLRQHVWPLLAARSVAPVVQETLPLAQAARAHEILESNAVMGKVVLVVEDAA
ncbi:MAG: NAD(P)H-quinone oxidoreductase [Gammaproteobacteria bacterium]|nr:NAD(P)H-quinone oxidoreductase [Gammaproteobacteria bacterium]